MCINTVKEITRLVSIMVDHLCRGEGTTILDPRPLLVSCIFRVSGSRGHAMWCQDLNLN